MKRSLSFGSSVLFASPLVLGLLGIAAAQLSACSSDNPAAPPSADGSVDAPAPTSGPDARPPPIFPDANVVSCKLNGSEDFISFCLQKSILRAEHKVFDPNRGIASSWSADTGLPDADGGATAHDVRDDVAYAASLSIYSISAQVYGDTEIDPIVTSDLNALAPLVEAELAGLPASYPSYEGELYLRLRRFAQGLRLLQDTANGAKIDAIADAYGKAIYATYFHSIAASGAPDAGADGGAVDGGGGGGGDAGADAGVDAGSPTDAGMDAGDGGAAPVLLGDGILGIPAAGGGFAYDVDMAASGALALVDLASRHLTDDPTHAQAWARAAGAVFRHLDARARHTSGLYYADLVTSADPDHDALATVVTPSDTLLTETQASVAASLLRASGIVLTKGLQDLAAYPFTLQVVAPLNGLQGTPSIWDQTPTTATAAACASIPQTHCAGSGFFARDLPSSTGVDPSTKTIRGNALLFGAIHRAIAAALSAPGVDAGLVPLADFEPLTALFTSQLGDKVSFLTQAGGQLAYLPLVSGGLDFAPGVRSYTAQATAYAIEALTEQWVGERDCPADFF